MFRPLLVLAVLLAAPLAAQQDEAPSVPVLDVSFEQSETVPGQPLSLRLTVLVPTFMPEPPVWPSYEAPNLLVRLPEGSTGPTSKSVGGETWAGVTRHYRIAPMVPGRFELSPQSVVVTYADPDTNAPIEMTLETPPLAVTGVVPDGAEALDPFLAARGLELTREIEGEASTMVPGDSLVLAVTAEISGTSPMFLPELLPAVELPGVAVYADDPILAETEERGVIGGSRTERVTFVAEAGGGGTVPGVSLDWYNLETGAVETASVDGFEVSVEGPPAGRAGSPPWRAIMATVLGAGIALLLAAALARRLWPPLRRWAGARRAEWLASETHAYRELRRVVARRDHAALRPALDRWSERVAGEDPRRDPRLRSAMTSLGAARYGGEVTEPEDGWRALETVLPTLRRSRSGHRTAAALPPLNPGA